MNTSFWDVLKGGVMVTDERAVEAIRRCSSTDIFKSVLSNIGVVIEFARGLYPRKELLVDGTFTLEKEEIEYLGSQSRIVKVNLKVHDERGRFVIKSHFYLIISFEGEILGILNLLN